MSRFCTQSRQCGNRTRIRDDRGFHRRISGSRASGEESATAELSLIHIIQLSLIHRSSLSLIRMRMRKVLAGPHRTHLGQFGIGRLAT